MIEKIFKKIISVFIMITAKLKFRNKIIFKRFSNLNLGTELNVQPGCKLIIESVSTQTNVHLVVIDGGQLIIGRDVNFNRNSIVVCRNTIKIGNEVIFGPNVMLYDHNHKFNKSKISINEFTTGTIVIEDGCWIGAGCIILKNTHIGTGSVIGAGCVISGKIPPHSLVKQNRTLIIEKIKQ